MSKAFDELQDYFVEGWDLPIEKVVDLFNKINDDLEQKDKRIAELEEKLASQNSNELVKKKYDSLKEAIKFLWEKQITDEHIFYVIDQLGQQHIDRIQDIENGICKIERLEKELAELKENAIVPKFKVGDEVWFLYDENDDNNFTIMHKKVMAFTFNNEYAMSDDGTRYTLWYGYIDLKYVFATLAEAEEALKKLEEV